MRTQGRLPLNGLIIDTSTEIEIVACLKENEIFSATGSVESSHASTLFHNLHQVLDSASLNLADLDFLVVGAGPGSFTGVRIAVSTVRMLSQVNNIPCTTVPTHLIYGLALCREHEQCLVAFDARKSRVFGAVYDRKPGGVNVIVPPGDYPMEELVQLALPGKTLAAVGSGTIRYRDIIEKNIIEPEIIPGYTPPEKPVLDYVLSELKDTLTLDVETILPDYKRKSDAEIMRKKKET